MPRRRDNQHVPTPAFLKDGRVLCGIGVVTAVVVLLTLGKSTSDEGVPPAPGGGVRAPMPLSTPNTPHTLGGGRPNTPYGGRLVNLIAPASEIPALKKEAGKYPSWTLTHRQLCDVELLMCGAFSPLDRLMNEDVYNSVVKDLRLGPSYNNAVFPMPITLDVSEDFASSIEVGSKVTLRDEFYNVIGILTVESKYRPDKKVEASHVLRTTDVSHPAVDYLMNTAGPIYLGGSIQGVQLPQHFDFPEDRRTPEQVRQMIIEKGWSKIVGFQTRNPMHRAHIELTRLGAEQLGAAVLIHPVVGMTKPGDVDYAVRVRCYRAIVSSGRYYKDHGVAMSLLPLAMRMAGPREALWHAIIRKNYGATHFIVGRDHAGCKSADGEDFYGAYDAQALVKKHEEEIGINIATFQMVKYLPDKGVYMPLDKIPEGAKTLALSGTEFRAMMASGEEIPAWFSDPDVIKILREVSPPKVKRGFAILFTGLSGGGKTTISHALIQSLQSILPTRHMTILDGDVVRTHLSKELGFSVADRNTNVARMGYVASVATLHGGIAICSSIAPFEKSRAETRRLVEATGGGFLLVHISTTAQECGRRDVKGLYEQAFRGEIQLTGVSHPYENPGEAELTINAGEVPVEKSVRLIIGWLVKEGYIDESVVSASDRISLDKYLTQGVVDPTARVCPLRATEPEDKTPKVVYAIAGPGDYSALRNALDSKAATVASNRGGSRHIVELNTVDVMTIEKTYGSVEVAPSGTTTLQADIQFSSGTPLTVPVTEDAKTEVAWDIWVRARDAGSRQAGTTTGSSQKDLVVVYGPRILSYLPNILRIDPCAQVIAVADPSNIDADVKRNVQAATDALSASHEKASSYLQDYYSALSTLKKQFPGRVHTNTNSAAAVSQAF